MKLLNYLFPTDWVDVETFKVYSYSHYSGVNEGISRVIITQYSPSTKKYRKQTINI